MAAKPKTTAPTWGDVKKRLAEFDRAGLLGLVQDLYGSSKDNQAFLHAQFGLGGDVLAPYKATIDRWLWPDLARGQSTSVATAKKAMAAYRCQTTSGTGPSASSVQLGCGGRRP